MLITYHQNDIIWGPGRITSQNEINDFKLRLIDGKDGKLNIKIPAGVQTSNKLRIEGKGYKSGITRGDLLGNIKIVVPEKLTDEEKELFEKLSKVSNFKPRNK